LQAVDITDNKLKHWRMHSQTLWTTWWVWSVNL